MAECFLNRIIKTGTTINNQDKTITANGQYTADAGYTGLGTVTVNVEGSGGIVTQKDINFYDMTDGATLVASYSLSDLPLSSLPDVPMHDRLTSQGWNYTLAQVNALTSKADIGAVYKTTSGDTEFDIRLTAATGLDVTLALYKTDSGTMTIDWGDNTTSTSDTTGQQSFAHTYSAVGDYMIKVQFAGAYYPRNSVNGNIFVTTASGKNYSVTAIRLSEYVTQIYDYAFSYCSSLKSITIPNSVVSINSNAFTNCISLVSITLPSGLISIGNSTFFSCYSLTTITIPNSVTSIDSNAFRSCYSLTSITIPNSVTSIGSNVFQTCYSLTSITIPNGVTSIGTQAFYNCYSITEYDFTAFTSVPTLSNVSTFTGINAICKIYVPTALYDTWVAATNWSTYASYIVAV
jgi:hypothetical protein